MKALPLILAGTIAVALSGCAVQANETPCKTFESAYNTASPGLNAAGAAYGDALSSLVNRIEPDAQNVALGEVQSSMMRVVIGQGRYNLSQKPNGGVDATPAEARKELSDSFASVAKACKDAGYPITLKTP